MKLRVFIPVLLALMAGPALGMEKPYKSYLKSLIGKLPTLGAAGLYGFIGWSAYQFIKNPKHKKLYAEDFNALGVRYLKTSEFAQDQWHVVYIAKRPIARNEQLLVNYGPNYWRAHGEPKPLNEKYRFYHARDFFKKYFEKIS